MNLQGIYNIGVRIGFFGTSQLLRMRGISIEIIKDVINLYENHLKSFLSDLKSLSLSKSTQTEIRSFQRELKKIKNIDDNYKQIEKLEDFFHKLSETKNKWNIIIFNEIRDVITIQPYLKGNLNYQKLLDEGIKGFIDSEVWCNMQDLEKNDLEDFRTCYLNKAWTSAGMMCMRVIESAVRNYYFDLTGFSETKWWDITDDLLKHPKSDKDLVKKLDYIRKHIRNPLQHPELRITPQEAEETFLQTIQILSTIYN